MTLKEFITALESFLPGNEDTQVFVRCQVAKIDCWLAPENIRNIPESTPNGQIIRIEGGIGA